jgi:hypothetical protein
MFLVYALKAELNELKQSHDSQRQQLLDRERDCDALRRENGELKKQLSSTTAISSASRGRSGQPIVLGIEETSRLESAALSSSRLSPSPSKPRTPTSGSRVQLVKRYPTEEEESFSERGRGTKDRKASLSQVFDVRKHVKQEMNVYRPVTRGLVSPLAISSARLQSPIFQARIESAADTAQSKKEDGISDQISSPSSFGARNLKPASEAKQARVEDLEEDEVTEQGRNEGQDGHDEDDDQSENGTAASEAGSTRFL